MFLVLFSKEAAWLDQLKTVTVKLNGLDENDKKTRPGLYELVEEESVAQSRIKFEMEYIQPFLQNTQRDAEIFAERRDRLLEALAFRKKMQPK